MTNIKNDPEEVMDNIMDRKKIIKVRQFKLSGQNWEGVGDYQNLEGWQNANPKIKILNTNITGKTTYPYNATPPPPPPPGMPVEEIFMFVTYEEYVNNPQTDTNIPF